MGRPKRDPERTAELDALWQSIHEVHEEHMDFRKNRERELRAMLAHEEEELLTRKSIEMNKARGKGLSLTRIGDAVGTHDWATLNKLLQKTEWKMKEIEREERAKSVHMVRDEEAGTITVFWLDGHAKEDTPVAMPRPGLFREGEAYYKGNPAWEPSKMVRLDVDPPVVFDYDDSTHMESYMAGYNAVRERLGIDENSEIQVEPSFFREMRKLGFTP